MNQIYLKMNNGLEIPQFGLGVCDIPKDITKDVCINAIKIGYRLIDTAHIYGNEREVGEAIKESGIDRKDLFITSKIWPSEYRKAKEAVYEMLDRMGLDYIDLVLLHQQTGAYLKAYKVLEELVKEGKVKSIGISNFESKKRLDKILSNAKICPQIHQIECHPFRQQHDLNNYTKDKGVLIESWFPLARGYKELMNNEIITSLKEKYHKTSAQIIIRWHIEEGYVVFPGTKSIEHLKENIDVFDFSFTKEEMDMLHTLDGKKKFNIMPLFLQGAFNTFQAWTILSKVK